MQPGQTLVLVDGSSLAFRSYWALFNSGLRRKTDNMATWAILGFFNSLFDFMEQRKPDGLAICFDLAAPTFRHEEFKEYKANRSEMPDDLSVQWPFIKQGTQLLNVPVYELAGYEADDVIGTVARQAQARGIKVQIFTGDYDAFQLVDDENDSVRVLVPVPQRHELIVYGRKQVFEKLGVWPEQITDYKGLCGDTSDNIPGVKGIGKVTAAKLLTSYKSIEGIYEHIEEIKGAMKQKLIDGRESAFASKGLATMRTDVPLDFDFEHCQLRMPKVEDLATFFIELEFKQMAGRLPKILSRFSEDGAAVEIAALANLNDAAGRSTGGGSSTAGGGYGRSTASDATPSRSGAVAVAEPEIKVTGRPEPLLITTQDALNELAARVEKFPALALELETDLSGYEAQLLGYALAWAPGLKLGQDRTLSLEESGSASQWQVHTAYVPLQTATGGADYLAPQVVHERMNVLLRNDKMARIAHNVKANMNALHVAGAARTDFHFDPMLASYIVNPDDKHSLKDMAQRLLGYSTVRAEEQPAGGRKQLTINFAALDKVACCAADDARIALELTRYYLEKPLDPDQQYLLYEMELPLTGVLARMEQAGVCLDLPYLKELSTELTKDLDRLESEIYHLAGHSFNIGSTQQLQKVLFDELGLKTKGRTKTGYSTDASVLESLKDEHAIVGKILEFRQLSKLRSTYVDSLPPQVSTRDHRLHGEFNQTTTATGRLSSSNPNLQNIPIKTEVGRRIRRAFIPETKGSVLLSADYSQIELRLLAHMSGDPILRDAFEKDQDIHARTAAQVFELPIEKVTANERRVGKTLNFALVYQQGPMATAQSLGITMKEASSFIDKYFKGFPNVKGFTTRTIEEARANGYVQTLWGRRRYFRYLNDRSDVVRKADERAASNAPLQGSAADLMKLAMIRLDKELSSRKMKAKLILQVHDELVLEVPKEELEEAKAVVRESMLLDQPFKCPLKVDEGVGENWMDAK